MRKIEIVFVAIFVAMIVLSAVAGFLGSTIHALFLNGMAVLTLIVFLLIKIEIGLSKVVSLLELQTLGQAHQVLSKVLADTALANSIAKSSKEALEKLKAEMSEPSKAPEEGKEQ